MGKERAKLTGNGEIEVLDGQQLRRDVLQLEQRERRQVLVDLAEDLLEKAAVSARSRVARGADPPGSRDPKRD